MDFHSDIVETVTPCLSYENMNYWKTEDSGYHTPGSLESSEISGENFNHAIFNDKLSFTGQFQVDCLNLSKEFSPRLKYSTGLIRSSESYNESPQNRRGLKRAYQEETENTETNHNSVPTPTSILSGGLRMLRCSDNHTLNVSVSSVNLGHTNILEAELLSLNDHIHLTYPTTPVKKICRNSCKLSPFNARRLWRDRDNFVIHSLTCETRELQPLTKSLGTNNKVNVFQFKPNEKFDMIKMLYQYANVMPAIMKIFQYLSHEDVHNFTMVSQLWQKVWEDVSRVKTIKREYVHFLRNARENQENKMSTPKNGFKHQMRPLMEIHNIQYNNQQTSSQKSPPGTPRTIKFKRYAKAAALDSRKQLPCIKCQRPAKVTEESSGEVWVECTSITCCHQFCRLCMGERHSDKKCIQYDLDGPSPSKRQKNTYSIGTKKSRKNLKRLLCP
ncbi:uncharacterized protein LOC125064427 [Vanessa atalanta]|uniref:uncharacterized protein LOC125064427 n=1 Tax=Vanessa atalanta TaxID=42275 RepID=UPI001FCDDD25|nr:uncharacterized protein LOC125064427 [Vanessa atalanta]